MANVAAVSTFDFIVIGSGPAGRRAAIQAAKLGKSVLVVEKGRRVGGVSVHTGTIPSKTLRETVLNLSGWRERGFYGRAYRVKQDIAADDLMHAAAHDARPRGRGAGAPVRAQRRADRCAATARFLDPHRVEVTADGGEVSTLSSRERVLIAVGTRPYRPDDVPFDGAACSTATRSSTSPRLPRSLTVIGAGVIGVEYATIFSALDVPVTLIEPRPTILDFIDRELIDDFIHQLRDRGMTLRLGAKVERIELDERPAGDRRWTDGRQVRSEMVLLRRRPRWARPTRSNLDAVRPRRPTTAAGSKVDPQTFQTAVPHIYAAGDVDRLSEPRLDLDGAGPHRRLPRLRRAAARRRRSSSPTASTRCRRSPPSA